jgi:putative urate catabolism protein
MHNRDIPRTGEDWLSGTRIVGRPIQTYDPPYPRDMVGYAGKPPVIRWPNNGKIAVQFVLNFEEGGENCVLHGDKTSETHLTDLGGQSIPHNGRNLSVESIFEFGSRTGFWRLHDLFMSYSIPVTVFGVGMALQKNPQVVTAMLRAGWEVASHGWRWINYRDVPREIEEEHVQKVLAYFDREIGYRPSGWYIGRCSEHTREIHLNAHAFSYDSDSYAGELPYWTLVAEKPHLVVPYTMDVNDMRFTTTPGFVSADQFYIYLKDTFDRLYDEGAQCPRIMSIGLHCRLIGHPGRIVALQKFFEYIGSFSGVWLCKREEIAQHWRAQHLPVIS